MAYLIRIENRIRLDVAHVFHILNLLLRPRVHRQALNFRNVSADLPVNARTIHAEEDT